MNNLAWKPIIGDGGSILIKGWGGVPPKPVPNIEGYGGIDGTGFWGTQSV